MQSVKVKKTDVEQCGANHLKNYATSLPTIDNSITKNLKCILYTKLSLTQKT